MNDTLDDGWIEMTYAEMDEIWDRFFDAFSFRPNEDSFPTITEPTPFVTFDIASTKSGSKIDTDSLDQTVISGLRKWTTPKERLCWLDWQHRCYWMVPSQAKNCDFIYNCLPWGDYSIFVDFDFSFGIYGEPHEQSFCIFGTNLIPHLVPDLSKTFRILRQTNAG